jgi:creatinine amidohydrolase
MGFEGTVSLRPSTMEAMIVDFVESLSRAGFRRFLLLNGNRRVNLPPMQIAASELTNAGGRIVAVADVAYLAYDEIAAMRRSPPGGIGHAGEIETSIMRHIHPDCIWMPEAVSKPAHPAKPQRAFMSSEPAFDGGDRFFLPRTGDQFREASGGTGVSGDPTFATPETGEAAFEAMVNGLVRVLDILKNSPLPPRS